MRGKFCRNLDKFIIVVLLFDNLMVMGDFNVCVGRSVKMWKKIIELYSISVFLYGE